MSSMGAGFAAGIGAGIAIGISSGQKKGQEKVCDYLESHQITLFDQEGKRIPIEDLRKNTTEEACGKQGTKIVLVLGLAALVVAAVVAFSIVR